jgi:outer membrane protein assembly factor BamA
MTSLEYSIPIIERVRVAAFYDAGSVNAKAYDFDTSTFADNFGFGLRINIPPMGPLRLDYAFPIHYPDYDIVRPDYRIEGLDGKGRFQFSVGWSRNY